MIIQIATPEDALNWCSGATSFQEFKQRVLKCRDDIDISILTTADLVTSDKIDTNMIDWR